jgi:hypothetical protein
MRLNALPLKYCCCNGNGFRLIEVSPLAKSRGASKQQKAIFLYKASKPL